MTSIAPTVQTKIAAGGTPAPQALQGASSGLFANLAGMNFMDLILARLTADQESGVKLQTVAVDAKAQVKTSDKAGGQSSENPLALLQIALAAQNFDADGNIVLNAPEAMPADIKGQLDMTNTIINQLKNVLPESAEKEGLFNTIIAKLQKRSDTLEASLTTLESGVITKDTPVEDIPLPLLTALGVNPSQFTEMTDKIQELEKKLGREITVEDLIAGVGGILPPPPQQAVLALTTNGAVQKSQAPEIIPVDDASIPQNVPDVLDAIDTNTQPTDDLAAQLNAIDVGAGGEEALAKAEKPGAHKMEGLGKPDDTAQESILPKGESVNEKKAAPTPSNDRTPNMVRADANAGSPVDPALSFAAGLSAESADAAIYNQYGFSATPGITYGSAGQASNLIATSATAGQAHPASQNVAATLTKFAQNASGDQTMTLRLDPPELGNVNIRLQFGKDKSLKAHLIVEKPETLVMLQRDGNTLERALHGTGFETGDGAISFELAQDNGAFAQNRDGSDNTSFGNGAGGAAQDASADVIQSTVMWQVDPSSGHVRYNIFA